jgi:hypothetical protein
MLAISARPLLHAKRDMAAAMAAKETGRFKALPRTGDATPDLQIKKDRGRNAARLTA